MAINYWKNRNNRKNKRGLTRGVPVRFKLAILFGLMLFAAMEMAGCWFNRELGKKTEMTARQAVDAAINITGLDKDSMYKVSTIELFGGIGTGAYVRLNQTEQKIWKNCRGMPSRAVERQIIDGEIYYVGVNTIPVSEYQLLTDSGTKQNVHVVDQETQQVVCLIGYVDITVMVDVIKKINSYYLIILVINCSLGCLGGYMVGRNIEKNQRAQKSFFENTSHELRTPLTSIMGYAEGIEKGVITDEKRANSIIVEQTRKMSSLVDDILMLAKIECGAMKISKVPVQLDRFIGDCLKTLEGAVKSRGLNVITELEPMLIHADPEKLDMAVSNLLTNAIKYAGTTIKIRGEKGRITIINDTSDVTDEDIRHIFERFYTGKKGSTGIGLALAKNIIEMHGWRITASRANRTIAFEITM